MLGWRAMLGAMLLMSAPAEAQQPPQVDVHALFDQAEREARVGIARKTMQVDARPARPGEVVVTLIAGRRGDAEPARKAGRHGGAQSLPGDGQRGDPGRGREVHATL
jgi:hypothetical protein